MVVIVWILCLLGAARLQGRYCKFTTEFATEN